MNSGLRDVSWVFEKFSKRSISIFEVTINESCCFKTGKVPTNELQIYTWKDASLKELTSLVREVNTESRRKGTFFDFALIYPSPSSRGNFQRQTNQFMDYISKEIGTTVSGRKGVDDSKVSSREQ